MSEVKFDFHRLAVYQKAIQLHLDVYKLQECLKKNPYLQDQLNRACASILLNIAEGSGRESRKERKHFLSFSRGSVFECVAIFDMLKSMNIVDAERHYRLLTISEEISRLLYTMISNLKRYP